VAPDEIPASARRSLDDRQLQRATRVVELAWSDLPAADRQLLDDIKDREPPRFIDPPQISLLEA
jgi:hypothetical protein